MTRASDIAVKTARDPKNFALANCIRALEIDAVGAAKSGHARRGQPILKRPAGVDDFTEFAGKAHRFAEDVAQTCGLGLFGTFGPSVDGDLRQRFPADGLIKILWG